MGFIREWRTTKIEETIHIKGQIQNNRWKIMHRTLYTTTRTYIQKKINNWRIQNIQLIPNQTTSRCIQPTGHKRSIPRKSKRRDTNTGYTY